MAKEVENEIYEDLRAMSLDEDGPVSQRMIASHIAGRFVLPRQKLIDQQAACIKAIENRCAAALLFSKQDATVITNKIRSCFIPYEEGDDEYALKAKAERYLRQHDDIGPQLEGLNLVSWWFVTETIEVNE